MATTGNKSEVIGSCRSYVNIVLPYCYNKDERVNKYTGWKVNFISLSKFNLPLRGTSTWPTLPGPYNVTTCRGRELNYGSHTYFFDHTRTWRASPDDWSAQCRGHLRDSTNMKDNTHQAHTKSSQQGEYGMVMTTAKLYSETLGSKVSWLCLIGEEKPRKNLTQDTCPDRGSNPGPLHDKCACYHLLHRGGLEGK